MKIKENSKSTPYDDVFRILISESGSLLIPFVNELFQFKEPLGNEQYADHGGRNQEKRITDAKLRINSSLFNLVNELKKYGIQDEAINRQKEEDALTSMQYNLFMDTLKMVTGD